MNKLNPFQTTVQVPSMGGLSQSLAYVCSRQRVSHVKAQYTDLFLKPPVENFTLLQFEKYVELEEIGYTYSKSLIEDWMKENANTLSTILPQSNRNVSRKKPMRSKSLAPFSTSFHL